MKNKALTTLLALAITLVAGIANAQSQPTVTIEPADKLAPSVMVLIDQTPVEIDSAVFLRSQQVMVWIRDLEKLGWGTVSAGEPGESLLQSRNVTLTFQKDQSVAYVNSLPIRLPIDTYIKDGKLMVPLSFVTKALGYKYDVAIRPVAVISTKPVSDTTGDNTLSGSVLYNGKGVAKVTVRAVDPDYNVIKGAIAQTDLQGNFSIFGLPDGDYRAYVYVDDNPMFFNRASDVVTLQSGITASAPPITLGRIITPLSPEPAEKLSAASDQVTFEWQPIPGAKHYELKVREKGKEPVVASAEISSETSVEIPTDTFKPGVKYEAELSALDARGQFLGGTAGVGGDPWTFIVAPVHSRYID